MLRLIDQPKLHAPSILARTVPLLLTLCTHGIVTAQNYQWSVMYNKNLEAARTELIATSKGKVILWHETQGIWISQNAADFTMLVSSEDFDRVYDNTQVLSVSADVQVIAGTSRFDQSASVGVVNIDPISVRWIPDSL